MDDPNDDLEPSIDAAWETAETFARNVISLGSHNELLRLQLEKAERMLGFIKGAATVEIARQWARAYFGEDVLP